jgi:hypothetical protein
MRKNLLNKLLILITLGLFSLNFTPAFAQILELEVAGGGYRVLGPETLQFGSVTASFTEQNNQLEIHSLSGGDCNHADATGDHCLVITDENGGAPFIVQMSIDSDEFLSLSTENDDNNITLEVQNNDTLDYSPIGYTGDGNSSDDIYVLHGNSTPDIELDGETDHFITLDTSVPTTLVTGTGAAPGQWEIYPVFNIYIPATTAPDTYTATVNITVI